MLPQAWELGRFPCREAWYDVHFRKLTLNAMFGKSGRLAGVAEGERS